MIDCILQRRGLDTVCVSKVRGHAEDGTVERGQARREDRLGNDAADEAADFGFVTGLFCPGLLVFGALSGFRFQLLPFVLMILLFGLILLVFWLSGSLS